MSEQGVVQVLESRIGELKSQGSQKDIVRQAMEHPIGSPKLKELARGKKTATIIISDHTRPVPSKKIIPLMLEQLREGNPDIEITLLVATGCHRGTEKKELVNKLGADIVEKEKIVVHDCDDQEQLVELGTLPSGARLVVNRLAAETDLLVAEGFIEPHFFAGFSGGRKSVLPGICSRVTVLGNHCAKFIDSPYAKSGNLENNPIHEDMKAAAKMAKLAYIVNVVIDEEKKVVAAFAGDVVQAHEFGCEFLRPYCQVVPAEKTPIVVTSNGGAPLDQNVYQTVKGLCTADAVTENGGVIILCAECADGVGGDSFYRALKDCSSIEQLLTVIRNTPMDETIPDQWQYQILAKILEHKKVIYVTEAKWETVIHEMKMEYAPTLEQALAMANEWTNSGKITVIPNGISVFIG
jgi:nickel-dependent lactate racemase